MSRAHKQLPQGSVWAMARHFWRVAQGKPAHVAIPAVVNLVANVFDAASLALLIPITKAVATNSFDFLRDSRVFGSIVALIPGWAPDSLPSDALLFGVIVSLIVLARLCKFNLLYLNTAYVVARTESYRVAIHRETFSRVLTFGRRYFDRQALGGVNTDIQWSNSALHLLTAAEGLFRFVVGLIAKGAVMFAISAPLFFAFLVAIPLVQWVLRSVHRTIRETAKEAASIQRRSRAQLLDILASIPLIKGYSQEEAATDEYEEVLREAEAAAVRKGRATALRYPIEELTILGLFILTQGALIALRGDFEPTDIATFTAFLIVLQQSLMDYKKISQFSMTVLEELPKLEVVATLFSDDGKHTVSSGSAALTKFDDAITLHGLTFEYTENKPVLHDINATIPAGRTTAIVGPSGAGKTTLVDLIARFYDCAPGQIRIDGADIHGFSLPSLHARMGIVSQEVWLLNRTLRDNLVFGLEATPPDEALESAMQDVELGPLLESLEDRLDTEIGDRGLRLSGGQRQRVALARALLREPDILILDEATSALDSRVEMRVASAIARRVSGHTLVVIAHRLSTIRDADQVLVLDGGRIVQRGTWDDLASVPGLFADLLEAQSGEETALPL